MIIEYDNILDDEPLRTVCVTVADDHQKLKVLADVLSQSTEIAPLGRDLADKYRESIIIIFVKIDGKVKNPNDKIPATTEEKPLHFISKISKSTSLLLLP